MKDEIKDILISSILISLGTYTRFLFGGKRYSLPQKLCLFLFGFAIVFILHLTKMDAIYQTSISLVAGLLLPNIINAIIKGGDKGEDKAAKNIEDKIDSLTK